MDFTNVFTQIIILFIIMFLGYYFRKINIISEEGINSFSSLIFYATMPALIVSSTAHTSFENASDIGQIAVASIVSYSVFVGVSLLIPRLLKVEEGSKGLYRFMTIFANVGFVGFPMLLTILGESAVFFGAVMNIPFNILLFTIGIYYIVSDQGHDHKMKITLKQFMNPGIIATFIGMMLMLSGIELPQLAMGALSSFGSLTTPLAMIVVGASLYGVVIKEMLKNYRVFLLSGIRMVVFPLIIGLLLKVLGISPKIIGVAIVLAGMPIATNTVIIARQYNGNVLEVSEAVFISTTLLLVTAPLLIWMIGIFA